MADSLESKRSEKKSEQDGVPVPFAWVKSKRRPIFGTKVDVDCKMTQKSLREALSEASRRSPQMQEPQHNSCMLFMIAITYTIEDARASS